MKEEELKKNSSPFPIDDLIKVDVGEIELGPKLGEGSYAEARIFFNEVAVIRRCIMVDGEAPPLL